MMVRVQEYKSLFFSSPSAKRFLVYTGSFLSGVLLQISMPPVGKGLLIFFAFVPLILVLSEEESPYLWGGMGFLTTLCWFISAPFAFIPFGVLLSLSSWLVSSVVVGAIFYCTCLMTRHLPAHWSWLGLPAIWIVITTITELLFNLPRPSPSVALAIDHPELLTLAKYFGSNGTDFAILAINGWVANIFTAQRKTLPSIFLITMIILLSALALLSLKKNIVVENNKININAIQPAFKPVDQKSAQWSLAARIKMEEKFDTLLNQAVKDTDSVVITPEGGNELFNKRIKRRRQVMYNLLEDRKLTDVLLAGNDLTPDGKLLNIVSHVTHDGFHKDIVKTHLVPLAEANLAAGAPEVVTTSQGIIGVSICYDSMFSAHFRAQVQQGAQILVVSTDDSSFGNSMMSYWHVAYSILHSIEAGKSLVYLSNHGPAIATNTAGFILHADWKGDSPAIYHWALPLSDDRTFAVRGGWYLPLLISMLIVGLVCSGISLARSQPSITMQYYLRTKNVINLLAAPLCIILAATIWIKTIIQIQGGTTSYFIKNTLQRFNGEGVIDGITPAFMQSEEKTCGAASISFLLTKLGDLVFEYDVVNAITPANEQGYTFAELIKFTSSRGFNAKGYKEGIEYFDRKTFIPFIAHMNYGHFVVVLDVTDDLVVFFDPAAGKTLHVERENFQKKWSGNLLVVNTLEDDDGNWTAKN